MEIELRARRCLSFDPGPKRCGFAVAQVLGARRPSFLHGGIVASDLPSIGSLIESETALALSAATVLTIVVELPGSYMHDRFRAASLLDTRDVGGAIRAMAFERDLPYVGLTVQSWRRRLCGGKSGTPGDTDVARVLGVLVQGMPERTSVHLRDALGLACVVLLGGQPPVRTSPAPVSALPPSYQPAKRRR